MYETNSSGERSETCSPSSEWSAEYLQVGGHSSALLPWSGIASLANWAYRAS